MLRKSLVVCLSLLLVEGQAFAGIILTLKDLGDGGGGYSYGYAINENGQATGTTTVLGRPDARAFYWNGSTMSIIDDSPVVGSGFGFDINNSGQIVGSSRSQAFRWDSVGGLTLLDPANTGSANGITQNGVVIGERTSPGNSTTMNWTRDGVPVELHPEVNSRGIAINNNLEIIGTNGAGGYFSTSPESAQLTIPLDAAVDLNLSRQIVGSVTGTAALYDFNSNALTSIGKLDSSDLFSIALGINSHGTAVGVSGTRGFIYDSTLGLQDATSLLRDDYLGWTILALEDINDKGQMIGVGRYNGVDHAVILSTVAVPEPNYVGDTIKGIKAAYRMAGDAIVSFCEKSDECEVNPGAEPTELRVEKADEATVDAAADTLASVIEAGKFKGTAKARAEKALEKLRSRH